MGKVKSKKSKKKRSPVEILMAILGVGFLLIVALIIIILLTKGCSVVHYPLDTPKGL
jgi:hypothetical protein